ncbi:shikimate dehydrogenase [Rubellicoccus peritrichatus]|uniref:Shikimate dehydrogenase (NADP(+)) n=1 Tax=Rubellicoccus peritrichatus TaxID=3080537 RepID=A0AAQ3QWE3_9BACT|nr:shikimate dehydrogenase [Puniceicoccus sp. CR14]WOO41790.1 shikimate dehydrogenase [Puniceicoccus sp. CR14]
MNISEGDVGQGPVTQDEPSRVRTLDDLKTWEFSGKALAVLGLPVAHSVSPQMHNAALNAMAQTHLIYRNWCYFKFEVPPEKLPEALPLFWEKGFHGLNLTIPHKVQAVDLVKEIDPAARSMGAVNTLTRLDGGGYNGNNSDGYGLETALERELDVKIPGADIVLLGAGGAARAAAVQCLLKDCKSLWIGNRSQDRLNELIALLDPKLVVEKVRGFDITNPPAELSAIEHPVIINATSLGLKADDPSPIDLSRFTGEAKIYDMTYGVKNALATQAEASGFAFADGLSMLVWQGVRSLEIWSNDTVPAQPMMSAACHAKGIEARRA